MARNLDGIVVVDIESTCWEGKPPAGQQSEIIEIGVCLLDPKTGVRTKKRGLLLRPERSSISPFCTNLTTLTASDVAGGTTFAEACASLRDEYRSKERTWACYGDYDHRMFTTQSDASGVPYPFGPTRINVKNLVALAYGLPREVGMARALELLGLPLEGTHHRGEDDAWNIAAILARLLARFERHGEDGPR